MYDAVSDPYCYPGTTVLKNISGIENQAALDEFEATMTAQRADEPLPRGRLSVSHYRLIHHHLFQDVYKWAGVFRTVRLSKDGSAFCFPENVEREMRSLFGVLKGKRYLQNLSPEAFAVETAEFLSNLNAIHPFREGNGRTQTAFLALLGMRAGHPVGLEKLQPDQFLAAMIASFRGDDTPLERQILSLIG